MILCLDSGTTAVKAAAFDRDGRTLAVAEAPNSALRRDGLRVEQDMGQSREDAFAVLRACLAQAEAAAAGPVEGLVVTGQGDGLWPIDASGEPAGRALTWLDGRARGLAGGLDPQVLAAVEAETGARPTAASQTLQLLWLRQNEPDRAARIARVLRLKEWLFLTLTGQVMGEPSAALPVWGDWRTGEVTPGPAELLGLAGATALLPEFRAMGEARAGLSPAAAAALGLSAGVPVLLGPGDVQATLIGLGLGSNVARASIFGTSAIHAGLLLDPLRLGDKAPGAMIQRFALGGLICFHPSFNGASLFGHVAGLLGVPERVGICPSGVILHPFFEPGGERAPYTSPHASGAILGLTAATTPEAIAWAAREGLAFVAARAHAMLGADGGPLALGGGLAGDADFARFLATVTGRTVERRTGGTAGLRGLGALGARFLLGAGGDDIAARWLAPPDDRVAPDGQLRPYAEQKYAVFTRLVDLVAPVWPAIAALADAARLAAAATEKEALHG